MKLLILLCLMAAASPTALAQSYTPLQPPHWGNWYDPDNVGEGIELSLLDTADGLLVFANVYLLHAGGSVFYSAQCLAGDCFTADREYELVLYQRPAPNWHPESKGSLWLRPVLGGIEFRMLVNHEIGAIERSATLQQLTHPIEGVIGICNRIGGFSPPLPDAGEYCH